MYKKIKIIIDWDDDSANIAENDEGKLKVKITNHFYKKMDPLFKLDFLTDMERWVQQEVDRIHKNELDEQERFTHTYLMRCPKSTKQWTREKENPGLEERLEKTANELRVKTSEKIAGNNVIKFRRPKINI